MTTGHEVCFKTDPVTERTQPDYREQANKEALPELQAPITGNALALHKVYRQPVSEFIGGDVSCNL